MKPPALATRLLERLGSGVSADIVKHHVERAARRANVSESGVHRLRHTFLFALGDAWRTWKSDSGAGRTSGLDHHAAVHAPESDGD